MHVVLVGGATETAAIDGISAAGATPRLLAHTPSADLEIVAYGRPVGDRVVPVSPSGCPTPAVVTRAVREVVGFDPVAVDAGLARPTWAPTVDLGESPGGDIRDARPVPDAADIFESARDFGRDLPDEELLLGETIPGGTTTAMAVLSALSERPAVSSSLASNPLDLKRGVVDDALAASGLSRGDAAGDPIEAVRQVGDPVLAAVAGLSVGAARRDATVTLAGGTQMAAAAALARHASVDAPLELATTSFVAADDTADIRGLAADLDLELTVTDPGFDQCAHPATEAYVAGQAKEGVGMGGALALTDRRGASMAAIRGRVVSLTDRLTQNQADNADSDYAADE